MNLHLPRAARQTLLASWLIIAAVSFPAPIQAQQPPEAVVFTTEQDWQNMLDQLEITQLRRGRDSNADSPHAAKRKRAERI